MRIRTWALLLAGTSVGSVTTNLAHAQTTVIVTGQAPAGAPESTRSPPPGYAAGAPTYASPVPSPGYAPGYAAPYDSWTSPGYAPPQRVIGPHIIADWSEGEPIPPGYHESTRMRKGLVIAGAVLFGTTYLLSALVGAIVTDCQCGGTATALLIPGAGPFVELGQSNSATGSFSLVLDGLSQVGGLAMFIAGLAVPRTVLVRDDYASSSGFHLTVSPIVGPGQRGMGLVGTF